MTQVPLLKAIKAVVPKAWYVATSGLKLGERLGQIVIVEVVVGTKLLFLIDPVVKAECELVIAQTLHGH